MLAIVVCIAVTACLLDYDANIKFSLARKVIHLTGFSRMGGDDIYPGFPYTFNAALTGVVLMYLGTLLRGLEGRFEVLQSASGRWITLLLSFAFGVGAYIINQNCITPNFPFKLISMCHAIYGNYLLFLIASTFLSIALMALASLIDNPLFARYGRQTMAIYLFQSVVVDAVGTLFAAVHIHLPFQFLWTTLIATVLICMMVNIIRRADSHLIGDI